MGSRPWRSRWGSISPVCQCGPSGERDGVESGVKLKTEDAARTGKVAGGGAVCTCEREAAQTQNPAGGASACAADLAESQPVHWGDLEQSRLD